MSRFARIATSLALALALCEIATRVWLGFLASSEAVMLFGDSAAVEALSNPRYTRHHYLPFIPTPGYRNAEGNRHNSLGFRGDEIEMPKRQGSFRVALLGGSTTYSTAVQDVELSYPVQLEKRLHELGYDQVEIINAGCGRYASWESLLNLQFRVLEVEPDLVVVYHGVNDVHPRLVYPPEAYTSDNSGARTPYVRPETTGWDRSALLRVLRTALELRDPVEGLLYLRTFDYLSSNFAMEYRDQLQDGSYPDGIFLEHPVEEMLARNEPGYFRRNLESMVAISRMQGVETLLMTFAWSDRFTRRRPHAGSQVYRDAYAEQNELIREICREHQVPCYDFAKEMPADRRFWHDGRHVSEEGSRRKAQLVASYLARSGLLAPR